MFSLYSGPRISQIVYDDSKEYVNEHVQVQNCMPEKFEKYILYLHHVFNKYFSQILAWRSSYVLCIPCLLWQPKRDNVKEETECERCPVQLAVRWKKMLHHKGSFAISLEWGSWCRMEIGWFTDMMVLWIKKNVSNHLHCWFHSIFWPSTKKVSRCVTLFGRHIDCECSLNKVTSFTNNTKSF